MSAIKRERLLRKFSQQVQYIQRSCEGYDNGFEDEAIRIATSLRVIFHDTNVSTSLIKHLGFGNKKMLSSAATDEATALDFLSWEININSSQPVSTRPQLRNQFRELSIKEWWSEDSVFAYKTKKFPRRKIILSAANRDGGAHVDELENFYEALSEGMGDGISITGNLEFNGEPPFEQGVNQSSKNAHLALIRQFAYEFLTSLSHFSWLK